ncbi:hypothetical protein V8G54_026996 [Vigna mungo]|uniref:Protein kinase domain-containing protein n=1 Tax=Vigna mungo TaxID=3915 RepID=A0AAQ3N1E1_VIGMU
MPLILLTADLSSCLISDDFLCLKVALDAAKGLAFLHSAETKVIYTDFKTSNILLDSNYNAKLSDFGLAKDGPTGDKSHVSTRVMGTYRYAAPEYLPTEMLSGKKAVDKNRPSGQHNLVEWAKPYLANKRKIFRVLDTRLEGQYSTNDAYKVANLALRCLSIDSKFRPNMDEVVRTLETENLKRVDEGGLKNSEIIENCVFSQIRKLLSVELLKCYCGDKGIVGSYLVHSRKCSEKKVILHEIFEGSVSSFVKTQRRCSGSRQQPKFGFRLKCHKRSKNKCNEAERKGEGRRSKCCWRKQLTFHIPAQTIDVGYGGSGRPDGGKIKFSPTCQTIDVRLVVLVATQSSAARHNPPPLQYHVVASPTSSFVIAGTSPLRSKLEDHRTTKITGERAVKIWEKRAIRSIQTSKSDKAASARLVSRSHKIPTETFWRPPWGQGHPIESRKKPRLLLLPTNQFLSVVIFKSEAAPRRIAVRILLSHPFSPFSLNCSTFHGLNPSFSAIGKFPHELLCLSPSELGHWEIPYSAIRKFPRELLCSSPSKLGHQEVPLLTVIQPFDLTYTRPFGLIDIHSFSFTSSRPFSLTGAQPFGLTVIQPFGLTGTRLFSLTVIQPFGFTGTQSFSLTGAWSFGLTVIQPFGLTCIRPFDLTGIQPFNLTESRPFGLQGISFTVRFRDEQRLKARSPVPPPSGQSLKITERPRLQESERSRSGKSERSAQSKYQKVIKPRPLG